MALNKARQLSKEELDQGLREREQTRLEEQLNHEEEVATVKYELYEPGVADVHQGGRQNLWQIMQKRWKGDFLRYYVSFT